ncbi:MAG: efflux RND transporter periplasmic adaptor subunit [Endozoicomonas sp.]
MIREKLAEDRPSTRDTPYLQLIQLEKEVRQASDETALQFLMVNRIRTLIECRQSVLLRVTRGQALRVCVSADVPVIEKHSPLIQALETAANERFKTGSESQNQPQQWQGEEISAELSQISRQWSTANTLWIPLVHPDGQQLGVLWLARNEPFSQHEITLASHLSEAFAHAWLARMPRKAEWLTVIRRKPYRWMALGLIVLLMLMPVRLSVLAPAEVVANDPVAVSAPMDAVVSQILVQPNQLVSAGETLVAFEDTGLRNQVNLAREELSVAAAELRKTRQQSFTDGRSTALVAELEARTRLKRAELAYAEDLYGRSTIRAEQAGIVVFRDENDWNGKPVRQGERIIYLADPARVELRVFLPARDAITLEAGTPVKLFLDVSPLAPVTAVLTHASYDAEVTPDGLLAYRLTAQFEESMELPRIGLRGTAKLFGEKATLFMYLFRRPLSYVRQWLGL